MPMAERVGRKKSVLAIIFTTYVYVYIPVQETM